MIDLVQHVRYEEQVDVTDLVKLLENYEELWEALRRKYKGSTWNDKVGIYLTDLYPIDDNDEEFLAFMLLANLNDKTKWVLRVMEVYYDPDTDKYHHGDAFADIKNDIQSIKSAVDDFVENIHEFPLVNRNVTCWQDDEGVAHYKGKVTAYLDLKAET
jgi:hypothetical protein